MKRIPLAQLKKILRVGDYVGSEDKELFLVREVTNEYFTCGFSGAKNSWDGKREFGSTTYTGWKTWYWLPMDLVHSPDISRVAKERRKMYKEQQQCTQLSATTIS